MHSGNQEDVYAIRVAMIGFSRYQPLADWNCEQYHAIRLRLDGDLAGLEWFADCAEAVRLFSCLCLGAMLGKHAAGEIDDIGFLIGDAHLAGFTILNEESVCEQWNLAGEALK